MLILVGLNAFDDLTISILSGLCGVLFPNKTANAMKG